MGVKDAAVLFVWLVNGEVGNHATAHKLLGNKLPCKSDVLIKRKFVLQGNIKAICKLGFLAALGLLHGVPEGGAVFVLGGGLGRQEDVCADHAALVGVVANFIVIFAVKFLPGAVGGGRDHGLSGAPFDLGDVEVEQSQSIALLLVNGAAHQGSNFRQGKNFLYQSTESRLAHAAHLRGHAFHFRPTGDKVVSAPCPFGLPLVADSVFQPLDLMLILLRLGDCLVMLFL